jgi:hypothetical protein
MLRKVALIQDFIGLGTGVWLPLDLADARLRT